MNSINHDINYRYNLLNLLKNNKENMYIHIFKKNQQIIDSFINYLSGLHVIYNIDNSYNLHPYIKECILTALGVTNFNINFEVLIQCLLETIELDLIHYNEKDIQLPKKKVEFLVKSYLKIWEETPVSYIETLTITELEGMIKP